MRLALFDLDHTLLPLDSDVQWGNFAVRLGIVDASHHRAENDRFYQLYQQGRLDIHEYLAFQVTPLGAYTREQLDSWHAQFMDEVIRPAIRPEALELVASHREAGDLCALVTATNDFVTAPIAREFGIENLISTQLESVDGRFTGRTRSLPSYRDGKAVRTAEWLRTLGHDWSSFDRSWFYSDSVNDIALMSLVTDPVATNPDPRLAAHASEHGWRVLNLFA